MSYPTHLLPQPGYQIIAWRDEFLNCFLIRSAPVKDVIDPETEKIRAKYVNDGSREHLKDFSSNLLGVFQIADAAIRLEKTARKSYLTGAWTVGEDVTPPTDDDFSVLSEYGYFFYHIGEIQNFPQPFLIANQLPSYVGRCYVVHTPKRANFWHFSIRWKIGEQDVEETLNENERRNLLGLVRSFLIERAIVNLPDSPLQPIEDSWYKTQPV
jgi:hypothetical protein